MRSYMGVSKRKSEPSSVINCKKHQSFTILERRKAHLEAAVLLSSGGHLLYTIQINPSPWTETHPWIIPTRRGKTWVIPNISINVCAWWAIYEKSEVVEHAAKRKPGFSIP